MIDNEKPLVLTERELKQLVEVIVDNKFLEYIDYFRAEQEKSIQMAQQNQELDKLKTQVTRIQSKVDKLEYKVNKGVNNDKKDV